MSHLLSILVVALNEADHLPLLMEHVKRLHRPHGWSIETILVDGGSRDQSLEIARAIGFTRIIQLPGASIPVSRNRALREASGDMLAFLDGDCLPDRDWLEKAAPYLTADEPVLMGFPVHPARDGNWIQQAWYAHWRHKNTAAQLQAQMPFEEGAFRLITTRNMLLNRRLLDLVPAFNETLTTGEDTDFAFRASEAGAHLLALPTLIVTHLGEPSTLGQYFRQQLWHANRKAYATILRSSGGKRGANAIFFSLAFLLSLLLALAALVATAILRTPWPLLGLLPLAAVTAAPALLIALLSLGLNLYIIPRSNATRVEFEAKYIKHHNTYNLRDIHYQISPGQFVYIESFSRWNNTAYRFTIEDFNGHRLTRKVSAETAAWDSTMDGWHLRKVFTREYTSGLSDRVVYKENVDTVIALKLKDLFNNEKTVETLPIGALNELIRTQNMRGDPNVMYANIEKQRRMTLPFSVLILTIIGVSLSARKRRGGIGWNIAIGIALAFSYIFFLRISEMFVYTDTLPPAVALWLPNLLYAIIAAFLYRKACQ